MFNAMPNLMPKASSFNHYLNVALGLSNPTLFKMSLSIPYSLLCIIFSLLNFEKFLATLQQILQNHVLKMCYLLKDQHGQFWFSDCLLFSAYF